MSDAAATHEDTAVVIPATTLLANDTDADGDSLTVTAVGTATHGAVTLAGGSVTFTPEANFSGTATFEYTVSDGTSTRAATVTVTVHPVQDAPVAVADGASTDEDTLLYIPVATLLANDTDADGAPFVVAAVGTATHGTVTLAGGNVTFIPEADFFGTATFEYTVSDGTGTGTARVTVTVNPVQDAPVAVADTAAVDEDSARILPTATLLANDTDADGDTFVVTEVGAASHGTVTLAGGDVTFIPEADFFGTATFEYTISDGSSTGTARVTVTVNPVQDAPVAVADTASTDEDTLLSIPVATLLANDTDADGVPLVVASVGAATHGTVALANGTVTFRPEANFFGTATFEYTVSDGTSTRAATVTVTVNSVRDAPIAVVDSAFTDEDDELRIPVAALLANDRHGDGDALTVSQVANARNGTVQLEGNIVRFTPAPGFVGAAGFEYQVSDSRGATATAPVALIVRASGSKQVVTGSQFTCAYYPNRSVKCWGANNFGQLGLGHLRNMGDGPDEMGAFLPFVNLGASGMVMSLELGSEFGCALQGGGYIKCWGDNRFGSLGLGDTNNRGDGPGEMGTGMPLVDLGTGRSAKVFAAGGAHTCAILDNDTLKCWGLNAWGQLGLGDHENRGDRPGNIGDWLSPVDLGTGRTARGLAAGGAHTCAILDDGSVKCWGDNQYGQLGLGDTRSRGDDPGEMGDALPPVDLGTGRTAKTLAAGGNYVCAILDDGTVKCWGDNRSGTLGLGDTEARGDDPGEMGDALPLVELGTGRIAMALAAGVSHVCALLDDASVKCWGDNRSGSLGLGDIANRGDAPGEMGDALPPVSLGTGRIATSLTAGTHTCASLDDGGIKCWGANQRGQLGLGDTAQRGAGPGQMGDALPAVEL
ncbi:tandem-95 repeat protein [Pyxidicoccus fallax]|uniref:Tandem-95 repeat protein n=1 Tax=Pyxidicoccus fallax TaxID=394095 RepID=A0A848LCV5_9BACT|nr:tandem-95 repeat protein [Pyxidicoccus fallax]NPC77560.1 tandem-95 repeat protein [Pyxidicoccus fallax]